jgi:hypothetical protein
MADMKRYVLRVDSSLTAIDLYTILFKLGTIPTYVNVPEGNAIDDHLKKYFIDTGVTITDGVPESPSPEDRSETVSQTSAKKATGNSRQPQRKAVKGSR